MSRKNNILGFSLVELPRTGVEPFQILQKHNGNKVEKIGKLYELFPPNDIALPAIEIQKTPNNISDKFSLNLNLEAKIKLFNGLYRKFAKVESSAKFGEEDEFMIIAENAAIKEVASLNGLNNYINDAKLKADITNYESPLKKGNIFVITSVLTCKKFAITLASKKSLGIGADSEIKDIASLKASLERSKVAERSIFHEGEDDLVIGFKAHKLRYDKSFWQSKDKAKYSLIPADHIGVLSDENLPVELLATESGSVVFVD